MEGKDLAIVVGIVLIVTVFFLLPQQKNGKAIDAIVAEEAPDAAGVILVYKDAQENLITGRVTSEELSNQLPIPEKARTKIKHVKPLIKKDSSLKFLAGKSYVLDVDKKDINSVIKELQSDPRVAFAEPDYYRYELSMPNDPYFNLQWALHNDGTNGGVADSDIDLPEALDIFNPVTNVTILVTDTGVNYNHPDLVDNMWFNEDEIPNNGVDDDNNNYVDDYLGLDLANNDTDPMDDKGHGTHVAGIIAAGQNNSLGISGVCPTCKIMACKFLDYTGAGITSKGIECLAYGADNGARILQNSWGGPYYSELEALAIASLSSRGILIVASAGNSGIEEKYFPASAPTVFSVTSSESNNLKPQYATFGSWVNISAPGGDLLYECTSCSVGNCCRYPANVSVLSTVGFGQNWNFCGPTCGINDSGALYTQLTGTSMASPHVSGVAGLLWSMYPNWSLKRIENHLLVTSDDLNALNPNYAGKMGAGKVNAYNALLYAENPVLFIDSLVLDDSESIWPNGYYEAGEEIIINLSLINYFPANFSNVSVRLFTPNNLLMINNSFSTYPDFLDNEIHNNLNLLTVNISEDFIPGNYAELYAEINYTISGVGESVVLSVGFIVESDTSWPKISKSHFYSTSLIEDFNNDGEPEFLLINLRYGQELGMQMKLYDFSGHLIWKVDDLPLMNSPFPPVFNANYDSKKEIALGTSNLRDFTNTDPSDAYLSVYDSKGKLLPNWPKVFTSPATEGSFQNPAIIDDKILTVLKMSNGVYQARAYDFSGNLLFTYPMSATPKNYITGLDIDADGTKEIIFSSYTSASTKVIILEQDGSLINTLNFTVGSSVNNFLFDNDGDSNYEIIIPGRTIVLSDMNGIIRKSWGTFLNPRDLIVSNLDNNPDYEIIVSKNNDITVLDYNFTEMSGWPKTFNSSIFPILTADVDSDNVQELVFTVDCKIHVINVDGSYVSGFPRIYSNDSSCLTNDLYIKEYNNSLLLLIAGAINSIDVGSGKAFLEYLPGNNSEHYAVGVNSLRNYDFESNNLLPVECLPQDYNCDYVVNIEDLLTMFQFFGQNEPSADLYPDGIVNVLDFYTYVLLYL